mmetsp:Transcript_82731/g.208187  ORF Transcript_82731/g.208187 Transcript_82731/m.208187 type:complete len:113 (+) Transcript_82731:294-632(+)
MVMEAASAAAKNSWLGCIEYRHAPLLACRVAPSSIQGGLTSRSTDRQRAEGPQSVVAFALARIYRKSASARRKPRFDVQILPRSRPLCGDSRRGAEAFLPPQKPTSGGLPVP